MIYTKWNQNFCKISFKYQKTNKNLKFLLNIYWAKQFILWYLVYKKYKTFNIFSKFFNAYFLF